MTGNSTELIACMEPVALAIWGEPSKRTKNELRFGSKGSVSVDLRKGMWFDHEAGEGGGVLDALKQHLPGIQSDADALHWLEENRLWANGRAGDAAKTARRVAPSGEVVAAYDYTDEQGGLLFQVLRLSDPATGQRNFHLRRPDTSEGEFIYNLKGVRRVPYRLSELLEAVAQDQIVFLVEGEKDVDNCRDGLGVPATCNPMGAGKWSTMADDLNPFFEGANLVIIADNDDAGRAHANDVAAALTDAAHRVRVLDLGQAWSACPPKGDVSDFLEAGGTVEQLYAMIEILPDWQPPPPSDHGEAHGFAWHLFAHGEAATTVPRKWLVDGLLPETGVALISGQWGTYKTFCAFALAAAVMLGQEFIRFPVRRKGAVLLIATEGQSEIATRVTAAWQASRNAGNAPFIWIESSPQLLGEHAADILTVMVKHAAQKAEREYSLPISLVLVDALGKAAGYSKSGEENDAANAKVIMQALAAAAAATGTLFVGVTHFGKHIETGTRGSSSFEDDADAVLALIGERGVNGVMVNTRLCLRKCRAGPSGEEFPFRPEPATVGAESTLTIKWLTQAEAQSTKSEAWPKSLRLLRQTLMNILVDHGKEMKPWADGPTMRVVDIEIVRQEFYRSYPAAEATDKKGKDAAKRKAFGRAIKDARDRNIICTRDIEGVTYVWLVQQAPTLKPSEMPLDPP
jgi:hypothetical protein